MAPAKRAKLKFLADLDEPLVYVPSKGGGDETEHVGNFAFEEVEVHDGREIGKPLSIDREGFELLRQETKVRDFYDREQVRSTWHDEVRTLLTGRTGASRVEIFDDTLRSGSTRRQAEKNVREPADIVHNDYTARSGIKRLKDHFADDPAEADELLQKRFAIINVWRSVKGPVLTDPLVLCDATTTKPETLVSVERRADERIGELQVALHDPAQRWYYFPEMQMDEALLLKTFDSATDGRTRFTIHSSFSDPDVPAGTPARESIETRCLVFFD